MCCLFGLIDYKNTLTVKQKEKTIKVLSTECEARGTDAAGIAYIENGKMKIFKKPLPAHKMRFRFKLNPTVIMGHTRLTTQGKETLNYNNHPFYSEKLGFSLAHNGVIHNDRYLRSKENLPDTIIETAVQLIEQKGTLDFNSVAYMAEKVKGSFCFTILSKNNELYIVKGNNPIVIAEVGNTYIYASTEVILKKALKKLKINNYKLYALDEGEIVKFECFNKIDKGNFEYKEDYDFWNYGCGYFGKYCFDDYKDNISSKDYETEYLSGLYQYARMLGVDENIIDSMLESGYDYLDIENMLYDIEIYGESYYNTDDFSTEI